ncbi:hypothetical protein ACWGB8_31145 [Kitasatospora sp. NPDC054939]
MDIVVVLELDTPSNVRVLQPDHTPADPDNPVRRAHTAPAESSGACGPRTLCGLDTSDMTLAPYRAVGGRPRWHTCSTCQASTAKAAPVAREPAAPESPEQDAPPPETTAEESSQTPDT